MFDLIHIYSGVRCFVHKCRILYVTVTFIVHVCNGAKLWVLSHDFHFLCGLIDVVGLNTLIPDDE